MSEPNRDPLAAMLLQVLATPESRHLETKRVSGKMVGKALETNCAFANSLPKSPDPGRTAKSYFL